MNCQDYKVRVKNMRIKHIVDLIKIDLKYFEQYGERYYSRKELKRLCKKRKITLDDFLKFYKDNPKHYVFNKMVIENNKNGFWIGETITVPSKYIQENHQKIKSRLIRILDDAKLIAVKDKKQQIDLADKAISEIFIKCGNIIKNFYFDMNLMFNILTRKVRYYMINIYRKDNCESKNLHYESIDSLDHTYIGIRRKRLQLIKFW